MFFLLRLAFWFSLVLLALPLGSAPDGTATVGPLQAISAAREAVGDLAGICERKPDVCQTGRDAVSTISVRAQEGSRIALKLLDSENAARDIDENALTGTVPAPAPR
ncbi:MAG: hypothetical protein DI629_03725 [Mesorhizobium amorphae]|nr:MAG: hypothetical protein DI629_03725 [Mesorhizobium amorphae]